jgi:hypothetical protein
MTTESKSHSKSPLVGDLVPSTAAEQKHAGDEELRPLAYQFWQERGCPADSSEEDWYRAEQEMAASNGKSRAAHHA